jgi:hypothetical protein
MSKWRDKYKVHPAADVFPMMDDAELAALGEDIKANGLRIPIWFQGIKGQRCSQKGVVLIAGRNRMEAMERIGMDTDYGALNKRILPHYQDATSFIISENIHRRHLTKAQRADLIVDAIKAGEKLTQAESVSRGGRGKRNTVKQKAVAEAKKVGISKGTVSRAIAKSEGRKPKPTRPKRKSKRELEAIWEEDRRAWKEHWLRDHPGRAAEYDELLDGGQGSPMWLWRGAVGRAGVAAECEAWLRDHPGNPLPEDMCGLTDKEEAEYLAWQKTYSPSEERLTELKSLEHLSLLKAAWDAADKQARDRFLEHIRALDAEAA